MNTFCQMWPDVHTTQEAMEKINRQKSQAIMAIGGREPANLEEQALCMVGRDIFEALVKEYTEKQWGRPCNELPAFIIKLADRETGVIFGGRLAEYKYYDMAPIIEKVLSLF